MEASGQTHRPDVSVVTVTWNSAATLRWTIDSFLEQTVGSTELVIVDGNSKDDTVAIAQSYGDPRILVESGPDSGIYDAMNKGVARARGNLIGFLNSDDAFASPQSLARLQELASQHDIAAGSVRFVKDHVSAEVVRYWRATPYREGAFQSGWSLPHPGIYANRHVFDAVGNFNTIYRIGADYDWLLRALVVHGMTLGVTEETIVNMQVGGASTSGLKVLITNLMEPLRARQKWLGSGAIDYALFARASKKIAQVFARTGS